jgi:dipeptidyl aminopeptidase/acylaminoacyl peptidase
MRLRRLLPLLVAVSVLCTHWQASAGDNEPFTIDDYFELNRVTELALSSDGEMIAYVVESPSLEENDITRTVLISATTPGAKAIRVDTLQEGRSFAWIPGTHELAYLLRVEGTVQVISTDTRTNRSRQHTNGDFPVTAFQFAPDGSSLAWLTQSSDNTPITLYERLFHGNKGIIIDPEHTVVYQFVNPEWPNVTARTSNQLWLKQPTVRNAERLQVPVPGKTTSFYWSSDASKLSITYVDNSIPHVRSSEKYTSLGVYDASTGTFRSILQGRPMSTSNKARYYSGGEWIPEENRMFVHRTEENRLGWGQKTEWSVVDLSKDAQAAPEKHIWQRIDAYGNNAEPVFLPVDEDTVYSERTIRALPSLYEITPSGFERARLLENIEGAISSVRFSADFATAAFVNENIDRPPEVYIWRDGHNLTQLTHLNRTIADKTLPRVKEVVWQSKDGMSVQGWLLRPDDDNGKPWPLITFVHGGPTFAFTNEFAKYFSLWPYPFAAYAVNGIAVFIPNYRGTGTFGHKFENPSATDKEPVDDIISGIDYLIAEGVADPARLGISGQSHGAWLAPLVMTKDKRFTAGSFAEAGMNKIVNYNLMPGFLNREVHDWLYGASLYDDPAKYIELSADMHFKSLDTAVLFEAGAKASAINMTGPVKAALYAGMPAEFVIYPQSSHNLRIPRLQKESAERNLDWFRFWLQDYEDSDIEKTEQYSRWRKMRLTSEHRAER